MVIRCWVCKSSALEIVKPSNIDRILKSEDFAITDSQYGITGSLYRCKMCGFLQCADFGNVLPYYENLKDPDYEAGRKARGIQARKILQIIQHYCLGGRLLDVGAGSGIFVEQAIRSGYTAEGVEPSTWLQKKAQLSYSLPVYLGTLPHSKLTGLYDIVTMIDVIEHIPQPVSLLSNISKILAKDGFLIVVTPDMGSVMARLLGWNWWHFRVAHIGYFNKYTLNLAASTVGFKLVDTFRPKWYVTADYLFDRVLTYFGQPFRIATPPALKRFIIPLNLFDSMLCVFTFKEGPS